MEKIRCIDVECKKYSAFTKPISLDKTSKDHDLCASFVVGSVHRSSRIVFETDSTLYFLLFVADRNALSPIDENARSQFSC